MIKPEITHDSKSVPLIIETPQDSEEILAQEVRMQIMSSIPCYCDIQFLRKEFLTALKYPAHPFAKKIENLTQSLSKTAERL
jgi:hypothetical protein